MGLLKALVADQAGGLTFGSVRPLGLVSLLDTPQSLGFVSCHVLIIKDCDGCRNATNWDSFQLNHVAANHTWLLERVLGLLFWQLVALVYEPAPAAYILYH